MIAGSSLARRLTVAFTVLATACGPSSEARERSRILASIDEVRSAPDAAGRERLAKALATADAHTKEGILARDRCAEANLLLARTVQLTAAASAGLAPSSSADPLKALGALKEASDASEQAKAALDDCSQAAAELRLLGR